MAGNNGREPRKGAQERGSRTASQNGRMHRSGHEVKRIVSKRSSMFAIPMPSA